MSNTETHANKLTVASLGLTVVSSVCVFLPSSQAKQLAAFGVGIGASGIAISQMISGKAREELSNLNRSHRVVLKDRDNALETVKKQLNIKQNELNRLTQINNKLTSELEQLKTLLNTREKELLTAKNQVSTLNNKLIRTGQFTKTEAINLVNQTYQHSTKKVDCLVAALQRNYPEIDERFFNDLVEGVEKYKSYYTNKIREYEGIETFQELLDVYYFSIGEKSKVKRKKLFVEFRSYEDYKTAAENTSSAEMMRNVKLIDKNGNHLIRLIAKLRKLEARKIKDAELIVGTAHRSKGLEFDYVRLADDFPDVTDQTKFDDMDILADELNLLYVASTRAMRMLVMNEISKKIYLEMGGKGISRFSAVTRNEGPPSRPSQPVKLSD